jgi:hypothetical protein
MDAKRIIDARLTSGRGVVAVWQLLQDGVGYEAIRHATRGMREVHDGVFLSGHADLTDWQRWKAATVTSPGTALAEWSAGALLGFRDKDRLPTTVKRFGNGGVRVFPQTPGRPAALKVYRSKNFLSDVALVDDIWTTTVSRTVLDLTPRMSQAGADRMVRDVLRLRLATPIELRAQLAKHRGVRGTARLRALVDEYGPLPLGRTKSDAEVVALALLAAAGVPAPLVNVVVAGGEADLVWVDLRLIIELDGPANHTFPTYDARKQARWEEANWKVVRIPTDDVYYRPHRLLAAAPAPFTPRPSAPVR